MQVSFPDKQRVRDRSLQPAFPIFSARTVPTVPIDTKAARLQIMVVVLGTIWGLQISLSKMTGEDIGATSAGLLFIHVLLSPVYLALLMAKAQLFVPSLREIGFYVISAILVNIVPLWLELTLGPHMSAGLLTLISCLSPIMTVAFVMIIRSEKVTITRLLGVFVGVVAALVVLVPEAAVGDESLKWAVVAFSLPATLAAYSVYMKRAWPNERSPLQVSTGILAAGMALLIPIHFATSALPLRDFSDQFGHLPLFLLTISIGAEFYLYSLVIRLGGAVIASCADYIAVLAGLGWGFILFREQPNSSLWAAVALGTLALWLICKCQQGGGSPQTGDDAI